MSDDNEIRIAEATARFAEVTEERFKLLEARLDKHEEMNARLLGGLTQLWSGLEAVISSLMDNKTDEERQKFEETLQWYSTGLWKGIADSVMEQRPEETPGAVADDLGGEHPVQPDA